MCGNLQKFFLLKSDFHLENEKKQMKKNWFSAERTIHSNIRTFFCCCCWYPAIKIGRNDFKIRLIITKKRSRKKNDPKIRFQVDDDEMIHIQLIMIILICHMMIMMMDKHGIWIIEKDSIRESLICLTCLKYLTDDVVILFWLIMIKVLLFMAATTNQHSNQMMNEWTVLVENVQKKNLENSKDDRWGVPNFLNLTTNTTIKHEHHHHH